MALAFLIPVFMAWIAVPIVAWRIARVWFRLRSRWRWCVACLATAIVMGAIGATQVSGPAPTTPGVAAFVIFWGRTTLTLAALYLALGAIHAAFAARRWPVPRELAAVQFWLWHVSLFAPLGLPLLAGRLMTGQTGNQGMAARLIGLADALSGLMSILAVLLLLGLILVAGYRRVIGAAAAAGDAE